MAYKNRAVNSVFYFSKSQDLAYLALRGHMASKLPRMSVIDHCLIMAQKPLTLEIYCITSVFTYYFPLPFASIQIGLSIT